MNAAEQFASLPRGKEDKPLLFAIGPLVYTSISCWTGSSPAVL